MNIWIDFENSPHVLILKPIIDELQQMGHKVILTARDCSQTIELADFFNLDVKQISKHHGKNKIKKILGHFSRIFRLVIFIFGKKISVAISHGSRSQILAAALLRIPVFTMWDYEHAELSLINRFIDCLAVPDVILKEAFKGKIDLSKIVKYPGLKENIYIPDLLGSDTTIADLSAESEKFVITMRPPAIDAHYFCEKSSDIFNESLKYFSTKNDSVLIVLARTKYQESLIKDFARQNGLNGNIKFPDKVYNGLKLICNSDLIIGGGGTMNREAAVLGVPVYSIFHGKLGAVDRYLIESGKMNRINSVDDIKTIKLEKKNKTDINSVKDNKELIQFLIGEIKRVSCKV